MQILTRYFSLEVEEIKYITSMGIKVNLVDELYIRLNYLCDIDHHIWYDFHGRQA